jgi:hypothetical protein
VNRALRITAWAGSSVLLALAAFLPAALLGDVVARSAGSPNFVRLAVALAGWAVFSALLPIGLARLILGELYRRPDVRKVVLMVLGGALGAGVAMAAVVVSVELRYAYFDTDYAGLLQVLPFGVVVLTASAAAALATNRSARELAGSGVIASALGMAVLGLADIPGARDGISDAGWWAILAYVSAAAVALTAAYLLLRSVTGREPAGEPLG